MRAEKFDEALPASGSMTSLSGGWAGRAGRRPPAGSSCTGAVQRQHHGPQQLRAREVVQGGVLQQRPARGSHLDVSPPPSPFTAFCPLPHGSHTSPPPAQAFGAWCWTRAC